MLVIETLVGQPDLGLTVDNRSNLREVFRLRMNLRVREGDLERPAGGEAQHDLVARLFRNRGGGVEGVEEAGAESAHGAAKEPEERDDADFGES